MSNYPNEPLFERWVRPMDPHICDSVGVYMTQNGKILVCAPYVDPAYFTVEMVDEVCEAIRDAAAASKK